MLNMNDIENDSVETLLFPHQCPRCKTFLGAFELFGHILDGAHSIDGKFICYDCLTDCEKVKILEDYIKQKI
jgi:hypothetical protein